MNYNRIFRLSEKIAEDVQRTITDACLPPDEEIEVAKQVGMHIADLASELEEELEG